MSLKVWAYKSIFIMPFCFIIEPVQSHEGDLSRISLLGVLILSVSIILIFDFRIVRTVWYSCCFSFFTTHMYLRNTLFHISVFFMINMCHIQKKMYFSETVGHVLSIWCIVFCIYVLLSNQMHVIDRSIIGISYVFVSLLRPGQIVLNTISFYNDKLCYSIDGLILHIILNIIYQYWN